MRCHRACQTHHGADSLVIARRAITAQMDEFGKTTYADLDGQYEARMQKFAGHSQSDTMLRP
eukprot:7120203-Alexandrium_andersonii.AAC.1